MGINDNLAEWLLKDEGFNNSYLPLLIESAGSQLGASFKSEVAISQEHDWQYLIHCASILSSATNSRAHDLALRIAQFSLITEKTNAVEKDSAAIILERMANYPSIQLAESRDLIRRDIESRLPIYTLLKWTKKKLDHQIYLTNGSVLFSNSFQRDFWEAMPNYQMASISAPTSAGKSFIVKQWIAEQVKTNGIPFNVIFIVPTRALIFEVERHFRDMLAGLGKKVNVSSSPLPSSLAENKANVLVFTQERLQIFLNQTDTPTNINMLVIDEAHKVGDNYRGVLLQHVMEKIIESSPKVSVLFSSPLTQNPESLLDDYAGSFKTAVFKTTTNTVNQNLFWCSQIRGLPKKWEILLCEPTHQIKLGVLELESNPASKRLPFIAYTIGKQSQGNIIYVDGAGVAETTALKIYEYLGEEAETEDAELKELIKLSKEQIHSKYRLALTLKRGVAFHYGNMPDIIRMEIERLFSKGNIKFLICTSTLIEGVNTSCRNIFVRNPKKGVGKPMSRDDFWNLAGRAGRWGKEFQGNIFCIDPTEWENDGAPKSRTEFKIYRSTDKAILDPDNLLSFIQGTYTDKGRRILEYVFSYLYCQYKLKGSLKASHWADRFNPDILERLDDALAAASDQIIIPFNIIARNPGISPRYISDLLAYFEDGIKTKGKHPTDYLPPSPDIHDAVNEYTPILMRLAKIFDLKDEIAFNSGHAWGNAIVVIGWMRGFPLARIISSRIQYENKRREKKGEEPISDNKLPALIREVMERVETVARFYAPKYLSCYTDVLSYFLNENGFSEYAENLKDYGLLLEYGVSTRTQISLVSLGLGRATSLALSEFIKRDSLSQTEALFWLRKGNYKNFNLSGIMEREIEMILSFIGTDDIEVA